jgi:TRAP-type transport system periplasmic protein
MVQDAVETVSFPAWSEVCNKSFAGCGDLWKKRLGPIAGVK